MKKLYLALGLCGILALPIYAQSKPTPKPIIKQAKAVQTQESVQELYDRIFTYTKQNPEFKKFFCDFNDPLKIYGYFKRYHRSYLGEDIPDKDLEGLISDTDIGPEDLQRAFVPHFFKGKKLDSKSEPVITDFESIRATVESIYKDVFGKELSPINYVFKVFESEKFDEYLKKRDVGEKKQTYLGEEVVLKPKGYIEYLNVRGLDVYKISLRQLKRHNVIYSALHEICHVTFEHMKSASLREAGTILLTGYVLNNAKIQDENLRNLLREEQAWTCNSVCPVNPENDLASLILFHTGTYEKAYQFVLELGKHGF